MQNDIFDLLVAGLYKSQQDDFKSPYPPLLNHVLNHLALHLSQRFPHTLQGLLRLFELPVAEWWPATLFLPENFDPQETLLYEGRLSEAAENYYYEWAENSQWKENDALGAIVVSQENLKLRKLWLELTELYRTEPARRESIQEEYCQVREFLIRQPYTTRRGIRSKLGQLSGERLEQVRNMYEEVLPADEYWNCENCGPLKTQGKNLRGAKPSVCADHWPGAAHIHRVEKADNLLVIKRGIHLRTHLPGLAEIKLYDWLKEQQTQHPQVLQAVKLWPGVDKYDLRVEFEGEAWAIDVKDHKNPRRLGRDLKPIYGEGELAYKEGFYVFPVRRLAQQPDYAQLAMETARQQGVFVKVISDEEFRTKVMARLVEDGRRSRKGR